MDENKHNLYDKNILEFVTVAAQFCNMLENVTDFSRKDFLDKITKVLPLLYLKADLMPEYEGYEGISLEEFVDEDNYNIVRNNIALLLGQHDDFLDVFVEDMKYSDTPILCTVSECLADIYQDVKNSAMNFKLALNDEIIFESVAQCKENFRNYWGQKLVNVMRPLHEVKFSTDGVEE